MKTIFVIGIIVGVLILILGVLFFRADTSDSADKVEVVTTIFPLYDMATAIGGERVEVRLLLPPGTEPHSYEPTPSDIVTVGQAELFVSIGPGLEPWAEDILQSIENNDLVVYRGVEALTEEQYIKDDHGHDDDHGDEHADHDEDHGDEHDDEDKHDHDEDHADHDEDHGDEHEHAGIDPHIWLDFEYAQQIAAKMSEALIAIDPEGATEYRNRATQYIARLQELDNRYQERLASCARNEIIYSGHSAFGYLAARYDLNFVTAYGLAPDSEPSAQDVARLIDAIQITDTSYIFYEELLNPALAETLASEAGVALLPLYPGPILTREQFENNVSFIDLMDDNLQALTIGLECE